MSVTQRCVYIRGIGRVHVVSDSRWRIGLKRWRFDVSALGDRDRDDFAKSCAAADILADRALSRSLVLWSVRFTEKAEAA